MINENNNRIVLNDNIIEGLAVPYSTKSKVLSLPDGTKFVEIFKPNSVINDLESDSDIRLLVEHDDSKLLGRNTKNLKLEEREEGIYFTCELLDTTLSKDTVENIKNEILSSMSFDFELVDDESQEISYDENGLLLRQINKFKLIEISCVGNPAYSTTHLNKRSMKQFTEKVNNKRNKENVKMNNQDSNKNINKEEEIKQLKELSEMLALKLQETINALEVSKGEVKTDVKEEVKDEVKTDVKEEVKDEVKDEVKTDVKEEVKDEVKDEVKTDVKEEVKDELGDNPSKKSPKESDKEDKQEANKNELENTENKSDLTDEEKEKEMEKLKKDKKGERNMREISNNKLDKNTENAKVALDNLRQAENTRSQRPVDITGLEDLIKDTRKSIFEANVSNKRGITTVTNPLLVNKEVEFEAFELFANEVGLVELTRNFKETTSKMGEKIIPVENNILIPTVAELEVSPDLAVVKEMKVEYKLQTYRGQAPVSREMESQYPKGSIVNKIAPKLLKRKLATENSLILKALATTEKTVVPAEADLVDTLKSKVTAHKISKGNTVIVMSLTMYSKLDLAKKSTGEYRVNDDMKANNVFLFYGTPLVVLNDEEFTGAGIVDLNTVFVMSTEDSIATFNSMTELFQYEQFDKYAKASAIAYGFDVKVIEPKSIVYLQFNQK